MIRLLVFTAGLAFVQTTTAQTAAPPSFEVASIKPNLISKQGGEGSRREATQSSPGSLTMRNVTLRTCIAWAYSVQQYQVTGPGWIAEERYDVSAKAAGPAPEAEMRKMLQTLLAERFKLTLHRQQKELEALVAVVAKGGPKLKPAENPDGPVSLGRGPGTTMTAKSISMEDAVALFSQALQMPVVDQTGIKGRYDIALDLTPYIADVSKQGAADMDVIIDLMNRVGQEQFGLKLEPRKAPVEMLVVDAAEKAPVEN
jgi:uncharacterized protein (TIGR03435 family)